MMLCFLPLSAVQVQPQNGSSCSGTAGLCLHNAYPILKQFTVIPRAVVAGGAVGARA